MSAGNEEEYLIFHAEIVIQSVLKVENLDLPYTYVKFKVMTTTVLILRIKIFIRTETRTN